MKFRKKPVIVDAIQFTGKNKDEIIEFTEDTEISDCCNLKGKTVALLIHTLERPMEASINDWIIKGVKGEFYPCKPDIFKLTHEKVD